MRLHTETLSAMRLDYSLQVPHITIVFNENESEEDFIEYSDDWFVWLRAGTGKIAVGKEVGYLHLSSVGYHALRDQLVEIYTTTRNVSVEDAQIHLDNLHASHAQKIRRASQRQLQSFIDKVTEIEGSLLNMD